jgi:DNA repair protein RecN (Recombination protein N)
VIRQLRVKNLAVIDELDVELGPGLNVLTGETGAGKSVLLSAVAMLCGRRVSAEVIRTGESQASVEAILDSPLLAKRAVELGFADPEDETRELLVARTISARGRGKVHVNGRLSTVTLLAELMADALEIVSQGEHQRLVRPEVQTELVDAYGGLAPLAEELRQGYRSWHAVAAELHDRIARREERARREDQLRFEIEQIERVGPKLGELAELEREHARLAHVDRLAQGVSQALDTLQSEGGAGEALVIALGAVSEAAQLDPDLAETAEGLRRAGVELEEAVLALQRYGAALEADPSRLAAVEGRLGEIGRLQARYGADVEEILAHRDRAREELERIGGGEARGERLERELAEAARELSTRAARLDKARRQAGNEIAAAVQKQLRGLELRKAEFQVRFEKLNPKTPEGWEAPSGPRGPALASFVFSANPGEEPRRLRDVASGGELSRLLLALRNVLRDADEGRILLFDEIDAGVGGRSARRVGERLRSLGRVHQILCITHLAAIAALGETHYNVQKRTRGGRTVTAIGPLEGEARVDEIARLSGGGRVTAAARAHARELLSAS